MQTTFLYMIYGPKIHCQKLKDHPTGLSPAITMTNFAESSTGKVLRVAHLQQKTKLFLWLAARTTEARR